ncbi:unnamed protein product [Vitrella brassicaformis CCMP3155]|uniref:Uncharacterized protein n=2 Tax=Vitrella brassicaformis TaxID=1169539 RepID=A0A0G4EKX1_VITBC|nr:unnamed protein product [Vitrella brassicaformis CCMP3155]|eukprot:CEL97585.1 unnamed protein product [Vitrella brassicaformis CCMP3155]
MEPPINGNHYRLVSRSGRQPNNDGPDRIARETLLSIYGYIPPWAVTRVAPNKRVLSSTPPLYDHFDIDCSDETTRGVWERLPSRLARKWGAMARNLKQVTVRYPHCHLRDGDEGDDWCQCTWVSVIEAHATAREAHNKKHDKDKEGGAQGPAGEQQGGSLHTITFEKVELTNDEFRALDWQDPRSLILRRPLRSVTLSGLKSIRGLRHAHCTLIDERGWAMPSLERAEGHACGSFIRTSGSLTDLEIATDSSPRSSGLHEGGFDEGKLVHGIDRLKDVLHRHKIRSLTEIKAAVPVVHRAVNTSKLLAFVQALEALEASLTPATSTNTTTTSISTAFARPLQMVLVNRLTVKTMRISLPLDRQSAFPSPLFAAAVRHIARRAESVIWDVDRAHVAALTTPTTAEKELMAALRFDKATTVKLRGGGGTLASTAALHDLSPDAFPATKLVIDTRGGCVTAASILASKMPCVRDVRLGVSAGEGGSGVLAEGEVVSILRSIGGKRRLASLVVRGVVLGEGGLMWGEGGHELEIEDLEVHIDGFALPPWDKVLCEAGPCSEAAVTSFVSSVPSLLQLRGMRVLRIMVSGRDLQENSARAMWLALRGHFPEVYRNEVDGFNVTWSQKPRVLHLTYDDGFGFRWGGDWVYETTVTARRIDT